MDRPDIALCGILVDNRYHILQHENWEIETRKLDNFIRTKARPHLFYMPKIMTAEGEIKLKETEKAVDGKSCLQELVEFHSRS